MKSNIENQNHFCEKIEEKRNEKAYSYDEAIELSGNGWYQFGLLVTLSLSLLSMCLDMFSFSIVVNLCSCDFRLNLTQKSILISMPFVGPIITAYAWGYISDTRGRKLSLLIGMSGSFFVSSLCAFAPNWIVLAILKLIGTCFCSSAQSATYTMLGESCINRVKGSYMLVMTSTIHLAVSIYFTMAFFIGELDFSYDLGFIKFVPWRFLVLVLALPLGLSALCLSFYYESPKFLLNACREDEALEVLRKIRQRNGHEMKNYPVYKLILIEDGNLRHKDVSLLKSLWEQTAPLFKPPLLHDTLLLYYLIFVVFATCNSLFMWLPFLAEALIARDSSQSGDEVHDQSLCGTITQNSNYNMTSEPVKCTAVVDTNVVMAVVISGATICILNICMSKAASRKKALLFFILLFGSGACVATTVTQNIISSLFYLGILWSSLGIGPLFSYYVELYPTSFRGMAACLGVMASRISGVIGINIVGPMILSNCHLTFYSLSALLFSGVIMACFLPSDRTKKEENTSDT